MMSELIGYGCGYGGYDDGNGHGGDDLHGRHDGGGRGGGIFGFLNGDGQGCGFFGEHLLVTLTTLTGDDE